MNKFIITTLLLLSFSPSLFAGKGRPRFYCELTHYGFDLGRKEVLYTELTEVVIVRKDGTADLSYYGFFFDVVEASIDSDGFIGMQIKIFKKGILPETDSDGVPTGRVISSLPNGVKVTYRVEDTKKLYKGALVLAEVKCIVRSYESMFPK